ncbi:DUF805 domain-containing protein [Aliiroseovarius subalbicans]|uniref:DUF805 domain-containing protein n=1 Tax=Aliiroseovarius subalbicans TaxID=2925840 RepID=UPI001F5840A8|nr:DUF805 domain-containing protein [Aliiroseovarius subalbicans]MCI2399590.1 DUF805 domain-containing protein [Aliiroseovarius subalbicans]
MDFQTAVKTCFDKYVVFSGRASRSEYWWFVLFVFLGNILTTLADAMIFGARAADTGILSMVFGLGTFLPAVSAAVRRLHDTGRSGWWWWLWLLPIIGWIILIIWYATQGDEGDNSFGPDPLGGGYGGGGGGGDVEYTPSRIPHVSGD